jgi:hypothetical protein
MTALSPADAQAAVRALLAAQSAREQRVTTRRRANEVVVINKSLKSKRLRIQSGNAERGGGSVRTRARRATSVTADRKLVLQAAIVRVMKARKVVAVSAAGGRGARACGGAISRASAAGEAGDRAAGGEGVSAARRQRIDIVSLHFMKKKSN